MHTLIALMVPFFSATLAPVNGGSLEWIQRLEDVPMRLEVNGSALCRVELEKEEAYAFADVIIDIVDNGDAGKSVVLTSGDTMEALDAGGGNVRFSINGLLNCAVTLVAAFDEPEKAIDIFQDAGS